ncbi:putative O-antigen polymerase [Magnetofaba australis IT-1]|uniref:Putative O-antigen polymerase n=2 Tax=Magnetofaba TaxID=1472292 RepID=A0A1Y2K338_9PROT|nr:putative O-antigen polymerase [Magnetofaba australis IT-1]
MWLSYVLFNTRQRLQFALQLLFFVGVLNALYGIGAAFGWWRAPFMQFSNVVVANESVSGTFVNRNHFAGLLELTIPAGLALLMIFASPNRGVTANSWSERLDLWLQGVSGIRGYLLLALVVTMLGLMLSQSRGGAIALYAAFLIMIALTFVRRYRSSRERVLVAPMLVLGVILGGVMGVGAIKERIVNADVGDMQRVYVYEAAEKKIQDYPLFGAGGGSFAYTFPYYRTAKIDAFYDHAHNDYLEFIADYGYVGFIFLAAPVLFVFAVMVRAFITRRDKLVRSVVFASLTGMLSLCFHGLVDFNFQIPSNTLYFCVLISLGLRAAGLPSESRRHRRSRRSRPKNAVEQEALAG